MKDIFKNEKYMPVLGLICAFGWSLAYPFIKIGYAEFGINDIPGKIFFAGIRFLLAGLLGVVFAALLLGEALKWQYFVAIFMVASGIFVTNR